MCIRDRVRGARRARMLGPKAATETRAAASAVVSSQFVWRLPVSVASASLPIRERWGSSVKRAPFAVKWAAPWRAWGDDVTSRDDVGSRNEDQDRRSDDGVRKRHPRPAEHPCLQARARARGACPRDPRRGALGAVVAQYAGVERLGADRRRAAALHGRVPRRGRARRPRGAELVRVAPVSYTHLTLPTILR